jgi:hypothetical protein
MRLGALTFALTAGILLTTSVALAQSTPSDPNTPTSPSAPAAAAPTNNDDLVTCRYEKTTGSNFSRRVCHTQREWHQMNTDARDALDRLDRGTQGSAGGGGG